MRIFVTAKTRAREERVECIDEHHYAVWTKEAPEKGRANLDIARILANHFTIPQSLVELRAGGTSKNKIFIIHKEQGHE